MYPSSPDSNPSIANPETLSIDSAQDISPSKSWYFVAGGLLLVSIVTAVVAIVGVLAFVDDIEDFRDPQTLTITTDRAVSRDIWTSSASRRVTVVAIGLNDSPLPTVSEHNSSTTITLNGKEWSNIGSVDFPGPGQYVVSASPVGVEIALAPADRYRPIGIWSAIAAIGAVAAFVVWLLTMIRRRKAKKAQVAPYDQYGSNLYGQNQYSHVQYSGSQAPGQTPPAQNPTSPESAPYPSAQPQAVRYHKPGQAPHQVQASLYHKPGQVPHRVGPPPPTSRPGTASEASSGHEPQSTSGAGPSFTEHDKELTDEESADQTQQPHQRSQPRATVQPKPAPDPFNQHRKPLPKSPIDNEPSNDGPISKG